LSDVRRHLRYSTGYSTAFDGGATQQEGSHAVPKQPRGKRIGSAAGRLRKFERSRAPGRALRADHARLERMSVVDVLHRVSASEGDPLFVGLCVVPRSVVEIDEQNEAGHTARLLPSRSGWFQSIRQASTAALS